MGLSTIESTIPLLRYGAGTDIGRRREENQDSFGILEGTQFRLLIVADGMGGVKGGAVASNIAISSVERQLKDYNELTIERLRAAVLHANGEIFERGSKEEDLEGMGTTFVGLGFTPQELIICNVGDSRAYRVRGDIIRRLTEDHTLVQELVRAGSITEDQADSHPVSHMLTRSLGPSPELDVDCFLCKEPPQEGDRYLLCSDGLYNLVAEEEMREILLSSSIDDAIQELIRLANDRGGTDNVTVIIGQIGNPSVRDRNVVKEVSSSEKEPQIHLGPTASSARQSRAEQKAFWKRNETRLILTGFICAFIGGYAVRSELLSQKVSEFIGEASSPTDSQNHTSLIETESKPPTPDAPPVGSISSDEIPGGSSKSPSSAQHFILTNIDLANVTKRRQILLDNLEQLNQKLQALDRPATEDVQTTLRKLQEDFEKTQRELDGVKKSLEAATRKLATWYSRKTKLSGADPVNLAAEVSGGAEDVKQKKTEFEQITWEYLRSVEALRYNPNDEQLNQKVQDLVRARNANLQELSVITRQAVEREVSQADQEIAEATSKKEQLESHLQQLSKEMDFTRALLGNGDDTREQVRKNLIRERDVAQAELTGLNGLLPGR